MHAPHMTYYTKVVDNVSGDKVMGYASTARSKKIYYGRVDALRGGESQFVVTFSIWNNEASWSAGTPLEHVADAVNCRLRVSIPGECRCLAPFLYVRCTTADPRSAFVPIGIDDPVFIDVQGTISDAKGVILGMGGDHADIETKIRLKAGCPVAKARYEFDLDFLYNYDATYDLDQAW